MKKILLTAIFVLSLLLMCGSCESKWGSAGLGAAGGAVAAGGGYIYVIDREMKKVGTGSKNGNNSSVYC
jgi:hypothetical protein